MRKYYPAWDIARISGVEVAVVLPIDGPEADKFPLVEAGLVVASWEAPCFDLGDFVCSMYRPVEEHNDYTYNHLPFRNEPPVRLRKPEARFASLAARIARSNLLTRSRLK